MKNIAQKLGLAAEAGEDAMLAEVARLQSRLTTLEPLEAENFKLKNRIRQIDEDAVAGLLAERKITDERILNRLKPVLANYATRDERVAFLDDCGFKPEAAPAPDYYIDITTPTAPILYVCTKAGSYATAVWAHISGGTAGGVNGVIYDSTGATAYPAGTMAWVLTGFTLAGTTVVPGVYLLMSGLSTPTSPTSNQIPQIPIPVSGTIYWMPVAAGMVVAGTCATGGSTQIYVNSTGQF